MDAKRVLLLIVLLFSIMIITSMSSMSGDLGPGPGPGPKPEKPKPATIAGYGPNYDVYYRGVDKDTGLLRYSKRIYSREVNPQDRDGVYKPFDEVYSFRKVNETKDFIDYEIRWETYEDKPSPHKLTGGNKSRPVNKTIIIRVGFEEEGKEETNITKKKKEKGGGFTHNFSIDNFKKNYEWTDNFTFEDEDKEKNITYTVLDKTCHYIEKKYEWQCEDGIGISFVGINRTTNKTMKMDGGKLRVMNITKNISLDPSIWLNVSDTENMDDSHVASAVPDTPYGSQTSVALVNSTIFGEGTVFMRFNMTPVMDDSPYTFESVELGLFFDGPTIVPSTQGVLRRINATGTPSNWTEETVTWNQNHMYEVTPAEAFFFPIGTTWAYIDALDHAEAECGSEPWPSCDNLTFVITRPTKTNEIPSFYSKEETTNTDRIPYLEVNYTAKPDWFFTNFTATFHHSPAGPQDIFVADWGNDTGWHENDTIKRGMNQSYWHRLRQCPTSNEKILTWVDSSKNMFIQVFDGEAWGNATTLGIATSATNSFPVDFAYEQNNTNCQALVAYNKDPSGITDQWFYRTVIDGVVSDETAGRRVVSGRQVLRVIVEPDLESNYIAVLGDARIWGIDVSIWNGSSFISHKDCPDTVDSPTGYGLLQNNEIKWSSTGKLTWFWVDQSADDTPKYFIYTRGGSWSSEGSLDNCGGCAHIENLDVACSKETGKCILMLAGNDDDLGIYNFDGSSWDSTRNEIETALAGNAGYKTTGCYINSSMEDDGEKTVIVYASSNIELSIWNETHEDYIGQIDAYSADSFVCDNDGIHNNTMILASVGTTVESYMYYNNGSYESLGQIGIDSSNDLYFGFDVTVDTLHAEDDEDTTLPSITIESPENKTYEVLEVDLNYTAWDDEGIDSCWFKIDGGDDVSFVSCQNSTMDGLNRTQYNLTIFVNDTSNNVNSSEVFFIGGNNPPTVSDVILNFTSSENLTSDNLTAWSVGEADQDGHLVFTNFNFHVNEESWALINMPFDYDNKSFITHDFSGNNHHGNYSNGTQPEFLGTGGIFGGAMKFTLNTTNRVEVLNHDNINFSLDNFTVEFWMNLTSKQPNFCLLACKSELCGIGSGKGWEVMAYNADLRMADTSTNLQFRLISDGGNTSTLWSSIAVNDSEWHHFVITKNGTTEGNMSLFIDGVLDNSSLFMGMNDINSSTPLAVGGPLNDATTSTCSHTMDEFKLYRRILSSAQIRANYENPNGSVIVSDETVTGDNWSVDLHPIDELGLNGSRVSSEIETVNGLPVAVSFSLRIPSGDIFNSSPVHNNVSTTWFNWTISAYKESNIQPCVGISGICQTDEVPAYNFTNNGNTAVTWLMALNESMPAGWTLFASLSSSPIEAIILTDSNSTISSGINKTQSIKLWVYLNVTNAVYGNDTNRTVIHTAINDSGSP